MAQSSHTFRVFISSTFNDLKAERNALQERVYPRLSELCQQHGARFQPIDLRWGVSGEASLDQQAMDICLGEIARCQQISPRPNFIVLLGNRYGWCPPPAHIPNDEFNQILRSVKTPLEHSLLEEWYFLDENALDENGQPGEWRLKPRSGITENPEVWQPIETQLQTILAAAAGGLSLQEQELLAYTASATEQEIFAGALSLKDIPEHVLCFFRDIRELPRQFIAADYLAMLSARIEKRYPAGLDDACQGLVQQIMKMDRVSSARDVASWIQDHLQETPKATIEEDLLFFFRQVLVDYTAGDYLNLDQRDWTVDEKLWEKQVALKEKLHARLPKQVFSSYSARWKGDGITLDHIDQLCEDVYSSLSRIILDEIKSFSTPLPEGKKAVHILPDAALDAEGLAHHAFAEERLTFFVGRSEMLEKIAVYLTGSEHRSLAIVGAGGSGKSALMARAIEEAKSAHPKGEIVYRFIGATPGSSDGRSLLESLCHEISRRYGANEKDIPIDYRDLVPELAKCLQLATHDKPLYLFLDSLDQLSASQGAQSLVWLPAELPENVRLIVTTRPEEPLLNALQARQVRLAPLGGLSRQEGDTLLSQWLGSIHRTLQPAQRQEVLDKFECKDAPQQVDLSPGNPLYLKLAFEEARLWTSSSQPQEQLAFGIKALIKENMFNRLADESNHGEMLVSHALGYLAASRHGLAEDELVDLLSRDMEVYRWFMEGSHHLPSDLTRAAIDFRKKQGMQLDEDQEASDRDREWSVLRWLKEIRTPPEQVSDFLMEVLPRANGLRLPIVLWSRLSFDLAPYLTERLVDGNSLQYFYHRELEEVSKEVFLSNNQDKAYHAKLADYFRLKADPEGDRSWTGNNNHALSELPHHLTAAGKRDEVFHTLTDFKFLEHKAQEVGITRWEDENGREQVNSDGVHQIQQDMEEALVIFYGESSLGSGSGRAPLIRTAEQIGSELRVYCPICNRRSAVSREMLGQVITCPQEGCETRLKLNSFTIQLA